MGEEAEEGRAEVRPGDRATGGGRGAHTDDGD
jgi:hypothetical protein